MWRSLLLVVFLAVAGCAEVERQLGSEPAREASAPKPSTATGAPKMKDSTLRLLASRNMKPQPTRPLNVSSRCSHKDEIGTQTSLNLLVKEAEIRTFDAQVSMKGHGICRFTKNTRVASSACGKRAPRSQLLSIVAPNPAMEMHSAIFGQSWSMLIPGGVLKRMR